MAAVFYKLLYRYRRNKFRPRARKTALQPLYDAPPIEPDRPFDATRFLVVDCEMSGLDEKKNHLLSIGWVAIERARIVHASARHLLIQSDTGAGDSTLIHGLADSNVAGANSAAAVLMLLARTMERSVLVFHHAPLDIRFLQKAALENFRCPLLFSYLDTLTIEQKRAERRDKSVGLRLAQCRERYGLPPVRQHNAMADALATAELLLAQAEYARGQDRPRLEALGLRCSG